MNGSHQPPDPEDVALVPRFLSSLHDLDVLEQDSIRINCRVSGRPPPDIQWYSNGQRLVQDQRHKIIVNESGCHTLLISNCQLSDTGSLTCVARNRSGEAIAQVILESETFGPCLSFTSIGVLFTNAAHMEIVKCY